MIAAHQNLLTPKEVERDFRIIVRTQSNWRKKDPTFRATALKVGRKKVMFDRALLEAWLETKRGVQ